MSVWPWDVVPELRVPLVVALELSEPLPMPELLELVPWCFLCFVVLLMPEVSAP